MQLTKRLQTIANMIDKANVIYDVGCDHGYLDIYLASHGFDCVAIDVRPKVIEITKKNISLANLDDKIKVILNNGLENIVINDDDIVVLSGLGAKTILKITKNQPIKRLIVQSNDNLYLLRKTMMKRCYHITDEKIIFEDGKYYVVIKFEYGYKRYKNNQLLLGPELLKNMDDVFINYLKDRQKHFYQNTETLF